MTTTTKTPNDPIPNLAIGTIIEVDGTHIVAEMDPKITELSRIYGGDIYPIGQYGSIVRVHYGRRIIYAYVASLRMKAEYERQKGIIGSSSNARIIEADLFGEGEWVFTPEPAPGRWHLQFERGVSSFPLPQQELYLTPRAELGFVYGQGSGATIQLGEHVGAGGTPCFADMNELLGKHTAVLGSTGAGKSATVAAILHSILERGTAASYAQWHPRIVILDPHNEYGSAFKGHKRLSTDEGTLSLPYWLLNLQETLSLVIGKTEYAATSQTNIVKSALLKARQEGAGIVGLPASAITVDSPVPYKLESLIGLIDADKPPQASKQDSHLSILQKLDVLKDDARVRFMMAPWKGDGDPFEKIASQFLGGGDPMRIVDLSGVPNEVAGAASSAVARMLFSIKLWQTPEERQKSPVLLVCEEAHRYVPNSGEAMYEAAQEAVKRLAKEGRKYGIGLMLVSQRPSEVEATVLSQCNSWVVLRITNDADREHVRSILPDSLAGLTKVLSGLRRREAVFVGQAAMLPSRILVRFLADEQLPHSHDIDFDKGWQQPALAEDGLKEIAKRWRIQQRPAASEAAKK